MADDASTQKAPVFISHSHVDKASVLDFAGCLEASDIRCFVSSRDIPWGASWPDEIAFAIASCRALVIVLTEDVNRSRYVPREIEMAIDARKPLYPVSMGPLDLRGGLKLLLSTVQRVQAGGLTCEQIVATLQARLPETRLVSQPEARAIAQTLTKESDATLWGIYTATRSRAIVFALYAFSLALVLTPARGLIEPASYLLAAATGVAIVGLTRQLSLPVLFTIGLFQPVIVLLPQAYQTPLLAYYAFSPKEPIAVGLACMAGGLLMSLPWGGATRRQAWSLGAWWTWLAPNWSVLSHRDRVEAVFRWGLFIATVGLLAGSLWP